ncbi:MAG: hypothetical protein ACI9EF_003207 [Pseudohongiellaceae bacterium]
MFARETGGDWLMKHPLIPVMCVLALLLGLSLGHGLPNRYVPDDTAVRCALGIAQDLTGGTVPLTEALFPPAGRYTTYPMLLPDLDLLALGGRFVVGFALGEWSDTGSFKAAVFEDPGVAWLPARMVSWLMALLVPFGIYRAARELGRSRAEAALGAMLVGSSLLLVQYAHTARPWATMMGFGALTLATTLRLRRRQHLRAVLAPFAFAALAGASFQVGLAFLAFPVVGLLTAMSRGGEASPAKLLRRGALGAVLAAGLLATVGYPHVLLHTSSSAASAQGGMAGQLAAGESVAVGVGGQSFAFDQLSGSRAAQVGREWFGYEPVLVVLGLLGLLQMLWGRPGRESLLLVLAPAFCFLVIFLVYDGTHVRYLMPVSLFLALGAAQLLSGLARKGAVCRVLAAICVTVPVVQALRFDQLLARDDTRTLAAAALPRMTTASERIAMDGMGSRYGPPMVPRPEPLQEALQAGLWLNRTEGRVLEAAAAGLPPSAAARALLPVARFWRFDSYYASDYLYEGLSESQHRGAGRKITSSGQSIEPLPLTQWMDDWGIDALIQVDRIPDADRRRPLTDFTENSCELVWEISPTGKTDPTEAALPTDMSFALTQLWTYERPGPWIRFWRRADR